MILRWTQRKDLRQPVETDVPAVPLTRGGTIAAIADWSPACDAPLNLTNINGDITFQAADISGNPFNMGFSAALTGIGGFQKTGGGTLTLTRAVAFAEPPGPC